LGELPRRTGELSHQRPIVVVCHSGARSAKATMLLRQVGFRDVANMSGGMVRWKVEGLPVI
jgi:rhodanese-related sulfurtransferase